MCISNPGLGLQVSGVRQYLKHEFFWTVGCMHLAMGIGSRMTADFLVPIACCLMPVVTIPHFSDGIKTPEVQIIPFPGAIK
jgi:hypothetical protein